MSSIPELELSTRLLIAAAEARGINVEVLDPWESFIRLTRTGKTELVRQATKTARDSYVTTLVMENKELTKRILSEHQITVPDGTTVHGMDEAMALFPIWGGRALVIKPKSSNFGDGVTVFKTPAQLSDFRQALERAFAFDHSVLIETFVTGKEYRFLVIGDQTVAVLHRVPANVAGDGVHTIRELVEQKNRDPRRGSGYKTPLEFLRLGEVEEQFLSAQGLHPASIPDPGQTVFLRENSNISTGGDSLDFTDEVALEYKAVAVRAAKAVGARICGVDMLIPDLSAKLVADSYSIIELNFNPALHIHDQPYQGENRHTADKVLDELGF